MANGGHHVADVQFKAAPRRDHASGLLGWVRFSVGGLALDGVAVRRTDDRRLTLSFPERVERYGERHPYVRPINDASRRELEVLIFDALGLPAEARR